MMIISVLILFVLIHQYESNSTFLTSESSNDHNVHRIHFPLYPYDKHYDTFWMESVPSLRIHTDNFKTEFSYLTPNSGVGFSKSAKALSFPVAQEMLFNNGEGKYVPYDRDHITIYKRYLRNDIYLSECYHHHHNSISSNIDSSDIKEAFDFAGYAVLGYEKIIRRDPFAKSATETFLNTATNAKFLEIASQFLLNKKCITKFDAVKLLPSINIRKYLHIEMRSCGIPMVECDPHSRYRTPDSSCTNLANPTWGRSFTCHQRLLPPDYADGIEVPRVAHDSSDLPNPRILSTKLLPSIPVSDHKLTSFTMAFGQFFIHDIARTMPFGSERDIKCCDGANHPECMPITPLPHGDFLTKTFNQTCINGVRSMTCNPCTLGPRQQLNQASQTIDLSQLYGLELNVTLGLRTFNRGLMKSNIDPYHEEILTPMRKQEGCNIPPQPHNMLCFESGDGIRANQHPALQAIHTLFHRRHNQHAKALALINPHWNDEQLFQESRRIMIAEFQKIVYGEYVPAIMGKSLTKHFGLELSDHEYTHYDPSVAPATIQEFIVAAGRFGHSQVNDAFRVLMGKDSYSYLLRDAYFDPSAVHFGHIPGIIRGLLVDPTAAVDPFIVPDVHQFLYKVRRENFARDLPAINILRGREHGVPAYAYYLDYCFGYTVKGWSDLLTFIPKEQLSLIKQYYKHWLDIDLFVGGLSERRMGDATFGPTFACIIGIQFYHFKYGDRFYFEHGKQSGSFTHAQLDNIRHVSSLSNLLCKTGHIGEAQPNAFFLPTGHNKKIPCGAFPELDYSLWKF